MIAGRLLVVALALGALTCCGGDTSALRDVDSGRERSASSEPATPIPVPPIVLPPVHPIGARHGAPYPIVLVHGFMGGERIGPVDYWWKIPETLRNSGDQVYVANTEPMRGTLDRARLLAAFVDQTLLSSGAQKVNLVAHSMGGLDARLLISELGYGDRIASLTTIATPHRGTPVADAILGLIPSIGHAEIESMANVLAKLWDGDEQDILNAATALTTTGTDAFNRTHPDDPRVAYFSIVGRTTRDPLFLLHDSDFCDAPLWPTFGFLEYRGLPSDGLVPVESQKWGEVLETITADHYNEVGQPLGVTGNATNPWAMYRRLARKLHDRGY